MATQIVTFDPLSRSLVRDDGSVVAEAEAIGRLYAGEVMYALIGGWPIFLRPGENGDGECVHFLDGSDLSEMDKLH